MVLNIRHSLGFYGSDVGVARHVTSRPPTRDRHNTSADIGIKITSLILLRSQAGWSSRVSAPSGSLSHFGDGTLKRSAAFLITHLNSQQQAVSSPRPLPEAPKLDDHASALSDASRVLSVEIGKRRKEKGGAAAFSPGQGHWSTCLVSK